MNKNITILIFLMIIFCFSGCGHKSEAELTEIEQFRCQDSIQNVFDILGKTNIEMGTFGAEYYKYENLNLFGYEGDAYFYVRDDKDIIQSFDCSFELNKKEFEDVLSKLENEYGEYERHEHTNSISYVWEFSEEKAEELGYNRMSFSDNGDKKANLSFSDEWSLKTDEAYYEYLEEKNKSEILAEKTYNIGEDEFHFVLEEKDNGYSFMLLCDIEEKENAFNAQIFLNTLVQSNEETLKPINDIFGYCIFVGDGATILYVKNVGTVCTKDGETLDDYFSAEWIAELGLEESDYGERVLNFLSDFVTENTELFEEKVFK